MKLEKQILINIEPLNLGNSSSEEKLRTVAKLFVSNQVCGIEKGTLKFIFSLGKSTLGIEKDYRKRLVEANLFIDTKEGDQMPINPFMYKYIDGISGGNGKLKYGDYIVGTTMKISKEKLKTYLVKESPIINIAEFNVNEFNSTLLLYGHQVGEGYHFYKNNEYVGDFIPVNNLGFKKILTN